MKRRVFLQSGFGFMVASPSLADVNRNKVEKAAEFLSAEVDAGRVLAAAMHVRHKGETFSRAFGIANGDGAIFLLASISKPMSIAALMTLYDDGEFGLDDRVMKFIPEFTGNGRDDMTIRHLMTHTCGLPDQLPENKRLRQQRTPLAEFTERAIRTPLLFKPGTKYSYSSMGILIASEIAQRISDAEFPAFVNRKVFQALKMTRSSLGLGRFLIGETVRSQVEQAAPESGSGEGSTKQWDWNSEYWRKLAAPWGGAFGSAADVALFLDEFLHPTGAVVQPKTATLMRRNHNRLGLAARGLGFDVDDGIASPPCSAKTFGHTGATGTIAWSDPMTDTTCVILTTLPARAANPHPRDVASNLVAEAIPNHISQ